MWKRISMSENTLQNPHKIRSLAQIPSSFAMILSLTYLQVIITWEKDYDKYAKKSGIFLSCTSLTAIWAVYPQFFMHIQKLTCDSQETPRKQAQGKHLSKRLPSLQKTSWCTSMKYSTAATSLKVKEKQKKYSCMRLPA